MSIYVNLQCAKGRKGLVFVDLCVCVDELTHVESDGLLERILSLSKCKLTVYQLIQSSQIQHISFPNF